MNYGQLKQLACVLSGDPNQTRYGTVVGDNVNYSNKQFAFDSKALFKDAPIFTVSSGDASYDLPSDFLVEKMVTHKGLPLDPKSRQQLAMDYPGEDWTIKTGTPRAFNIDPEEARKQLLLVPIPQADDAGANLILTYCPNPADMTLDTDTPLNGYSLLAPYHIAIAQYAAWLNLLSETATPEVLAKMATLTRAYNDKVIDAIDKFKNTASAPVEMRNRRRLWI